MSALAAELAALFQRDLTRLLEEISAFPGEDLLWRKLPGISNSAGHLTLHLEGNLREYIGRQLGRLPYTRNRALEFNSEPVGADAIKMRIRWMRDQIPAVIESLSNEVLEAAYPESMWSRQPSTHQFLVSLHGHLNYHLGQIDYLRRVLTASGAVPFTQI